MRDEHFYTRCLKLNPEKALEYYLGRADFYCLEQNYEKAYNDFLEALNLGTDLSNNKQYIVCKDFIDAENNITHLSKEIETNPQNYNIYIERSRFYLLKNKYKEAFNDILKAAEINPTMETYSLIPDICKKIRESSIHYAVKNATPQDLINACKQRIEYAAEMINLHHKPDYWQWRAEHDLDEILSLVKDKTLGLYLRVNFYEKIGNKGSAISYAKKVLEKSKEQNNSILTYLYAIKLISYGFSDTFEIGFCYS